MVFVAGFMLFERTSCRLLEWCVRVGSLCCWLQVVPKDQLQVTGVVWEWVPCVAGCRLFQRTSCWLLEWCESGYPVLLVAGCSKGLQSQVARVVWEWVPWAEGPVWTRTWHRHQSCSGSPPVFRNSATGNRNCKAWEKVVPCPKSVLLSC